MSLPIPDRYFTLPLILFNISFGLLCSGPAQPISAAEGADKSIPRRDGSRCLLPGGAACRTPTLSGSSCPLPAARCSCPLPLPAPPAEEPAVRAACRHRARGRCRGIYTRGLPSPGKVRQTHNKP